MQYIFHTTCENSYLVGEQGEDINEMTQSHHMVEIDNDDFISVIAEKIGIKQELLENFAISEKEFIEDWGISCHKSHFQGLECLYIRHSGIEHIYVREDLYPLLLGGEEAQERRTVIDELDGLLDENADWLDAKDTKQQYQALEKFVQENREQFESNHILLASLFAYHNPYADIVKARVFKILCHRDCTNALRLLAADFSASRAYTKISSVSLAQCTLQV